MEARIDDQARGAEQERLEEAGAAERIVGIDAQLVGELLGVERPAFGVGREETKLAERRDVLRFLRDTDLQVMAGDAFVIAERR